MQNKLSRAKPKQLQQGYACAHPTYVVVIIFANFPNPSSVLRVIRVNIFNNDNFQRN